ncbi:MAG: RHS repeat-associated core domain-containing protein, partial [Candidatus Acidiferrum sp.]
AACYGYLFVGNRQFGRLGGGTFFSHADWLGTIRLTNSDANPTYGAQVCTSLAFGDGLTCTSYNSNVNHFTGKERDFESGLDNFVARYNASNMGRFMSPDPENISAVLNSDDPQAWNGYAYGRNNPLRYTDPEGLNYTVCDVNGKNCADLTDNQYDQYLRDNPNIHAYGGNLYAINEDGSETKVGSESYYDEKPAEALQRAGRIGQIGVNYAMLVTAPNYLLVGGAHFFLAGSTITTLGITPRFVPWVATSPALAKLINWMYQEGDQLWDGTAGAVRSELATGDPVGGAFHSQKAQDLINGAQNLLKSGTLSAHDQQVARAMIQKLSDALAGK